MATMPRAAWSPSIKAARQAAPLYLRANGQPHSGYGVRDHRNCRLPTLRIASPRGRHRVSIRRTGDEPDGRGGPADPISIRCLGQSEARAAPLAHRNRYVVDGENRRTGKLVNGNACQGFRLPGQLRPAPSWMARATWSACLSPVTLPRAALLGRGA